MKKLAARLLPTHSIFWRVFLLVSLMNLTIGVLGLFAWDWSLKHELSKLSHSGCVTHLSDYVISRYEQDLDIKVPVPMQDHQYHGYVLIKDMATGEPIFQQDKPEAWGEFHTWKRLSSNGQWYEVTSSLGNHHSSAQHIVKNSFFYGLLALVMILYSWFLTLVVVRPLNSLRGYVAAIGTGGDVSFDEKMLNRSDEIGQLANAIDTMIIRIQGLLDAKQHLLYDISHELRAPLARLQVAAEIVRTQAEQDGLDTSMHDRFNQEIETVNTILVETMALAKNDASSIAIQPVVVRDMVQCLISDIQFLWPNQIIRFINKTPNTVDDKQPMYFKISLLEKALKNIVENAAKYSPKNSYIDIHYRSEKTACELKIYDQGKGIPEQYLNQVSEPFKRLEAESTSGIGLGMSIAHQAMSQLDGSLTLHNRPEGGLVVTLTFPCQGIP